MAYLHLVPRPSCKQLREPLELVGAVQRKVLRVIRGEPFKLCYEIGAVHTRVYIL